MSDEPPLVRLRARYLFPVARPPIDNGVVCIRGQRIVEVGRFTGGPASDLGDVAILPGLVNAHTHLEFSALERPLGQPGMSLAAWIRLVIAERRATSDESTSAIERGLRESLAAGTTAVGEIATTDWRRSAAAADASLPHVTMFHELIAPTDVRIGPAIAAADAFLRDAPAASAIRPGLSPHAPYTVHTRLLDALVELSRRFQVPLAMHLAESPEEIELLHSGQGPLKELLSDLGAWQAGDGARLGSAGKCLERLAQSPRALVIHGNYLDASDHAFVARHANTMAVVYCPRTHAYFGHAAYPLAEMLARGVCVALGTDSRASNPDLSFFEEARFVAAQHPQISPARVLDLATLAGARALGLADTMGSLEAGKLANLAIVSFEDQHASDPHARLLEPSARTLQTWLNGNLVATSPMG